MHNHKRIDYAILHYWGRLPDGRILVGLASTRRLPLANDIDSHRSALEMVPSRQPGRGGNNLP